jgi:hypothetical protein
MAMLNLVLIRRDFYDKEAREDVQVIQPKITLTKMTLNIIFDHRVTRSQFGRDI